jgi:hypothetical protein
MKKVVINNCFGGFGVSHDALLLLFLNGFPLDTYSLESSGYSEGEFTLEGPDGIRAHQSYPLLLKEGVCYGAGHLNDDAALRSHPVLVHVVEHLGAKANTDSSRLTVVSIEDSAAYRIEEYDGRESVVELDASHYVQGYPMTDVPVTFAGAPRLSPVCALLPG